MLKRYEVLISDEWHGIKLTNKEYELLLLDLKGELNTGCNVVLENKEIVETGIIDDIREA